MLRLSWAVTTKPTTVILLEITIPFRRNSDAANNTKVTYKRQVITAAKCLMMWGLVATSPPETWRLLSFSATHLESRNINKY
jgi:hypothetical protein